LTKILVGCVPSTKPLQLHIILENQNLLISLNFLVCLPVSHAFTAPFWEHLRKRERENVVITRRSFLKALLGATAAMSLPGRLIPLSSAETGRGIREFRLSASRAKIDLGSGPDFWAWTYNGQVPGPEIRVKEGEVIRVVLKNYLPEETTIHWHGVPVPNSMDGVPDVTQKGVMPGETFVYEFKAKPAGTYIYHSHSKYQLDQGLYGALIIEPSNQTRPYDQEYTIMLEDWVMRDGGGIARTRRRSPMGMMGGMMGRRRGFGAAQEPLLEPIYDGYAINGRAYPATEPLIVQKGDRVKLRLLNPSSATTYDLRLAGHSLTITHADGNPVKPIETDLLRIGMGERYDVEFVANNPGHWLLSAADRGFGEGQLRIPILYRGIQTKVPIEPRFYRGLRFASYWDLRSLYPAEPSTSGNIAQVLPQTLSGGMHSPFWSINGQLYPDADPLVVRTVIVNPMQRMEIEFLADNPGKWFHHCHNLYHMMAGMANVVVYA
jgi:FtsP/CotA-like multicopper oxidase with cupredoxin domain